MTHEANKIAGVTVETISIPKYNVDYLKKKIEKLNRKAVKLGCDEMILSFGNEHTYRTDIDPYTGHRLVNPIIIEMIDATLAYTIPNVDGYELVAVLDLFTGENGSEVMVSAVPDAIVPDEYKNLNRIHCDHCGHNRYRKKAILIKKIETGEHKMVGSTCVKDFFNGNDPAGFMFIAEIKFGALVSSIDPHDGTFAGFAKNSGGFPLDEVLTTTAAVTKKFGFTSKKKAWDFGYKSTADRVWDNLCPYPKMKQDEFAPATESDKELAEKTLNHFTEVDAGNNDYLLNLKKIISLGYVPNKYMGFAASMVSSYQRAVEREAVYKAKKKATANSDFIGNVGERLKGIVVKVLAVRDIESDWGCSTLYTFQDAVGNVLKTFYTGTSWEADVDDKLVIAGTVKKHDNFRGMKSTMLNRVSVSAAAPETFSVDEFAVA